MDVVLHELALLASVQGEDAVVQASAADEEQAKKHAANAGTETVIVVSRSAPHGEAILQEVVIVLPLGASENIRNSGQPSIPLAGLLLLCGGLRGRETTTSGALWLELVRVEGLGTLAVALADVVNGSTGLDANEVWTEGQSCLEHEMGRGFYHKRLHQGLQLLQFRP